MIFRNYNNLAQDIYRHLLPKLPPGIKMVAGIPRSGMAAAAIISEALHCRLGAAVGGKVVPLGHGRRGISRLPRKHTIVVDDTATTGRSLKPYEKHITGVVYCDSRLRGKITKSIVGEYVGMPFLAEWQFMGLDDTAQYMVDMDGVLCEDCSGKYADEGAKYLAWMKTVRPLFLPLRGAVHTVCTSRLEKWRGETTAWLRRHNVHYKRLSMWPAPIGKRHEYKAEVYAKSDCALFVESSFFEAERIHELTKRPVLSIERMRFFHKS